MDEDAFFRISQKYAAGELTLPEAQAAVALLAPAADPGPEPVEDPPPAVDHAALDAEMDAALAARSR